MSLNETHDLYSYTINRPKFVLFSQDIKSPTISGRFIKSWHNSWEGFAVFFNYPKDIRKAIYTTNAIESLNSMIQTAVNKCKAFPSDQAAFKMILWQLSRHRCGRYQFVTIRLF